MIIKKLEIPKKIDSNINVGSHVIIQNIIANIGITVNIIFLLKNKDKINAEPIKLADINIDSPTLIKIIKYINNNKDFM